MKGKDFHCISAGSGENPLLIFLHGFLGEAQDWEQVFSCMESEFWCLAPDLPGHGKTAISALAGENTVKQTAADLAFFIMKHDYRPAGLVGYSMGGRIALQLALDFPGIPRKLVIESANPGIEDDRERAKRLQADIRLARRMEEEDPEEFFSFWYNKPLFSGLREKHDFKALYRKRIGIDMAAAAQALRGLSQGRQEPMWQKLDRLQMPVLYLAGGNDDKYTKLMSRATDLTPRSRLQICKGAGHTVHFEDTSFFSATLRTFFLPHQRNGI